LQELFQVEAHAQGLGLYARGFLQAQAVSNINILFMIRTSGIVHQMAGKVVIFIMVAVELTSFKSNISQSANRFSIHNFADWLFEFILKIINHQSNECT
jgi:hypothetical protein